MPMTSLNSQSEPAHTTAIGKYVPPLLPIGHGDEGIWTHGSPPDSMEVAWLRLESFHPDGDLEYVVLGCRSLEDGQWCLAADWKGESHLDRVEDVISHWMPYRIPSVHLAPGRHLALGASAQCGPIDPSKSHSSFNTIQRDRYQP